MSKRLLFIIHLSYWIYKFFLEKLIQHSFYKDTSLLHDYFNDPLFFSFLFISASTFYINYFFILPRYFNPKSIRKLVLSLFFLFVYFIVSRYLIEEILFKILFNRGNYTDGTSLYFYIFDNLYYTSDPVFMSTILWLLANYFDWEKERKLILNEKREAEISFLKSQINPHFIFNTLNNIYSLVYHKSEKALIAIEKFSELLRYITVESENENTFLSNEVKYIESLIALESIRIEKEKYIIFEKKIANSSIKIPSLLLIPFIENAFKHGTITDKEFPFKIRINADDDKIEFITENKINFNNKDKTSGIGLKNIKRRLELLFPNKHELIITTNEQLFTCNLTIFLNKK